MSRTDCIICDGYVAWRRGEEYQRCGRCGSQYETDDAEGIVLTDEQIAVLKAFHESRDSFEIKIKCVDCNGRGFSGTQFWGESPECKACNGAGYYLQSSDTGKIRREKATVTA